MRVIIRVWGVRVIEKVSEGDIVRVKNEGE